MEKTKSQLEEMADVMEKQDGGSGLTGSETIHGYNSPPNSPSASTDVMSSCCKSYNEHDKQLDSFHESDNSISSQINRRLFAIFQAPEFVERLSSYAEAELGETVTFSARYHALPRPTVKWFKDEQEIRPTARHVLRDDESTDSDAVIRLVISDVSAADEGAYKCKVENCDGVASTTGYLSVEGKSSQRSKSSRTSGKRQQQASSDGRLPGGGGLNSPPILGALTEQKSQEEREELELRNLPPSPLQSLMDSIRRGGGGHRIPVFYTESGITFADQDYEDVMSDEELAFSDDGCTPIRTPDNGLQSDNDAESQSDEYDVINDDTPRTPPVSGSGAIKLPQDEPCISSWASITRPGTSGSHIDVDCAVEEYRVKPARPFQRTRLGQLQLKQRLAIDLPLENCSPDTTANSALDTVENPVEPPIDADRLSSSAAGPDPPAEHKSQRDVTFRSILDNFLAAMDSPDVQFFVVFITLTTAVSALLRISPASLVIFVAIASTLWFAIQQRRSKLTNL